MTNIVIAGAGLGGLYLANRLIKAGVNPENIVLIEKREENHYTRPGHLNCNTFGLVEKNTNIPTPHSPAHHIKELERVMYENLRKLKVKYIDESFVGLQPQTETQGKGVITSRRDGTQCFYPADYVFDCTGRKAEIAQAVNAYCETVHTEPAFKTSLLVDTNPIPDHLVAHIHIPLNYSLIDFALLTNGEPIPPVFINKSPASMIYARERLRTLGWTHEAFPNFYSYRQGKNNKTCVYMETPPDLPNSQHREWIKLLLNIYSNGTVKDYSELKPSRKYIEKPRIIGFKSVPYVLNKVVHESEELPTVIMGFDSLKGFDYRLAHGVTSGIACCEEMLKHVIIADGTIQGIDSNAIEKNIFAYINGKYKQDISEVLTYRQKSIDNAFEYFSDVYVRAAGLLPETESIKIQAYQTIASQLAYQAAMVQFSKLHTHVRASVESLVSLSKCAKMLIRARNNQSDETREYQDASEKLQVVIESLSDELAAFDIEPALPQDRASATKLYNSFLDIKNTVMLLTDNPTKQSLIDNIQIILDKVDTHKSTIKPNQPSTMGGGGLADLLALLLLSGGTISVSSPQRSSSYARSSAGPSFGFFISDEPGRNGGSTSFSLGNQPGKRPN